jgi:predicted signal transduction protein with EAL and GGDEF domain
VNRALIADDVLREAARRFRAELRPYDALGRYGGEEFLALLPGCDATQAAQVAERLRNVLRASPVIYEGLPIQVTASFGVAATSDGADGERLICAADRALYSAKHTGRDAVAVARECLASSSLSPASRLRSVHPDHQAARDAFVSARPAPSSRFPTAQRH